MAATISSLIPSDGRMLTMTDIVDDLEYYAQRAMPRYPNDVCSRGKREIERLRKALKDVMNAANCPYEIARSALTPAESKPIEKLGEGQS